MDKKIKKKLEKMIEDYWSDECQARTKRKSYIMCDKSSFYSGFHAAIDFFDITPSDLATLLGVPDNAVVDNGESS